MTTERCCGTCRDHGGGEYCEACLAAECLASEERLPYWIDASKPHIVGLLIAFVVVAIAAAVIAGIGALIGGLTA